MIIGEVNGWIIMTNQITLTFPEDISDREIHKQCGSGLRHSSATSSRSTTDPTMVDLEWRE